ncbi:MAG: porin family protein [Legionellaceae bacterium]|nr:porin family protein [Legionellaceae bacterium]
MQLKKLWIIFLAGILTTAVSAGTMGPVEPTTSWFITANLGPTWSPGGETQTLSLMSGIQKAYISESNRDTIINAELFLGAQRNLSDSFFGQLGIALAATDNVKFSGDIWEDADPNFNNYRYNYEAVFAHIAIKGKLFYDWADVVQPYISASIGIGFNRSHNFIITPRIYEEVPAPAFAANTTDSTFAYTLEIGLQKVIDIHWRGGVGYEFVDWGMSSLGRAPGQQLNSGLQVSHFYTNGLQFNLTYIV